MILRALYTLLLVIVAPFLLFSLYRSRPNKPKFGSRWKEHFGITPALNNKKSPIWIHAVSVGESLAATPLIKTLKKKQPDQPIIVTTTTSTGAEQIAKLGELVDHRYMPLDFGFTVNRFIKAIKPSQLLIIETELWPNTLHAVAQAGVPITIVNARLSEKSRQNYARIRPLFNQMSNNLSKVLCQTEADANRFASLGVNASKLHITGSIKQDIQASEQDLESGQQLRNTLGNNRPVWIAASTHKGEDELALLVHQEIIESYPNALLILVPRHPERFDSVYELCLEQNFKTTRRSLTPLPTGEVEVYLADTMGEMMTLLAAADICFMGGSFVGKKVGGHNVLEPIALGIPTITGPSYYNFQHIVETLSAKQAVEVINEKEQLAPSILNLISNPRNIDQSAFTATSPIQDTLKHITYENIQ
ncbi:3-deoxy-D-manno-octulosonic acid transferase [Vibrio sinaloensis]|uniref:lipid IV(A) 3-deoxy-D-manno-octulosonic acid transferase n=1 Tax=Photobacterium sp. (strain ATCC 43367) TaxID=379097 RepID=UPI00057CB250|nr:lipid IV(A) 3-deoxy-D-manno-octulosonic acid transferase [Vibrio sinaloensis]KIE19470.1 3-deoxy-D-manno-octulosonic acid transferase [Vibrio sinaloensis]